MSILNGFNNIFGTTFGGNPSQTQSDPAQQVQGQQPQQVQQPQGQQAQNQQAPTQDPIQAKTDPQTDPFANLFTIDPNQKQKDGPLFNLNSEEFGKIQGQQNFTAGVSQEDVASLKEALGGNDAAVKAMLNIANKIGQNAWGGAVQAGAKLTESGVQHTRKSITDDLPNHFKRQTAQDDIYTEFPELKNPSIQPLVGSIQQMMQNSHPNATVQEVNQLVSKYFTEVIPGAFGKVTATKEVPKQQTPNEGNFASWLAQ